MKKSQAAVEFMLTYGWAILGVLVVVAALAYFGVFNFSKYGDPYCNFGEQMKCEDSRLQGDGWISLRMRNNFGVPINITNVTVTSSYGIASFKMGGGGVTMNLEDPTVTWSTGPKINSGTLFEINTYLKDSNANLAANNKVKFKVSITFRKFDSPNLHNITGEVMSTTVPAGACGDLIRNCHFPSSGGLYCERCVDDANMPGCTLTCT